MARSEPTQHLRSNVLGGDIWHRQRATVEECVQRGVHERQDKHDVGAVRVRADQLHHVRVLDRLQSEQLAKCCERQSAHVAQPNLLEGDGASGAAVKGSEHLAERALPQLVEHTVAPCGVLRLHRRGGCSRPPSAKPSVETLSPLYSTLE
eukprot:scaffold170385_cov36-Tisochrysis_lutea.AAC.1